MSIPGTNDKGVLTLTRCPSCSVPSIPPRIPGFPTALGGSIMSPDIAEAHKDLESPGNHVINLPDKNCNPKPLSSESCHYNYSPQDKGSRLAAWKHKKFDSFSSRKPKLENQLGLEKKGEASTSPTPGEINYETKLKKRRSVLFRLWSSITPAEQVSEANQTQHHQKVGDISATTDQQAPSHQLQVHFTEVVRFQKDQEQVPQQDILQDLQSENTIMSDAPVPDTVAGKRWEVDRSRDVGKGLEERIGRSGIAVDGSFIRSFISLSMTQVPYEFLPQTLRDPEKFESVTRYCPQMPSQSPTQV